VAAVASIDMPTRVSVLRVAAKSTSPCATAFATTADRAALVWVAMISMTGASGDVDAVTWLSSRVPPSVAAARSAAGPFVATRP
jgi:hypothetical protein